MLITFLILICRQGLCPWPAQKLLKKVSENFKTFEKRFWTPILCIGNRLNALKASRLSCGKFGWKITQSYFSKMLWGSTKETTVRDFFNEPCEHGEVKNPTSPYMHLKKFEKFLPNFFPKSLPPEARIPRVPLPDKRQFIKHYAQKIGKECSFADFFISFRK